MKTFQRTEGWSHCICSTSVFFLFWQHACASLLPIRRWSEMHRSLRSVRGKKISTKAIILNCIKTEVNFSCSSVHLLSQQQPEVYICSSLGSASMFKSRWFRNLNHFFLSRLVLMCKLDGFWCTSFSLLRIFLKTDKFRHQTSTFGRTGSCPLLNGTDVGLRSRWKTRKYSSVHWRGMRTLGTLLLSPCFSLTLIPLIKTWSLSALRLRFWSSPHFLGHPTRC